MGDFSRNRLWTDESVVNAIRIEAAAGLALNYSSVKKRIPALLRAAERVCGGWAAAVNAAGIDYEQIRRYRKWSKERIIEKIKEHHANGADLSWRYVSMELDRPLAAAVTHGGRFDSWGDALYAAGLSVDEVARYRHWTLPKAQSKLADMMAEGVIIQPHLAALDSGLLSALYRHGNGFAAERDNVLHMHQNNRSRSRVVEFG